MDAIRKRALVRAIESTVIKGNALVLKNDGQLVAACFSIKKYTDEIADLGKRSTSDSGMVGPDWVEGFDLGRGENSRAEEAHGSARAAQEKAKNALAAGIVRIFEERKRAERSWPKDDEALAMLKSSNRYSRN